jgi:hypothetical protein
MKRNLWILAIACLLLPGLITYFWFYSGTPRTTASTLPDYSNIDFPFPTMSTEIPISKPPENTNTVVLLDLQHQNLYSISEINPLVRFIESYGGSVQTTSEQTNLESSLKTADVYICIAPVLRFNPLEITQITEFVKRGGKLVIFADPTRNSGMAMMPASSDSGGAAPNTMLSGTDDANLLLEPFDMSFADDYLYNMTKNEGNFRNVILTDFSDNSLTTGIKQLTIYGGHSVHSNGKQLGKTGENTFSSSNENNEIYSFADLVKFGTGDVLAIGDVSLITSQYVRSSDNQVFTQNLAKYMTGSPREKTLADFPALFSGPVTLQPAGKMVVSGDLISAASSFEKYLQLPDGGLTVSAKDNGTSSIVLLSTFTESDANRQILKDLKINLSPEVQEEDKPAPTETVQKTPTPVYTPEMDEQEADMVFMSTREPEDIPEGPETIEVPYFSQVKTKDLGLVGLSHSDGKTTLLIMASTPEKVQAFMRNLATGGLSGCVVHTDLAACKVTDFAVPPQG